MSDVQIGRSEAAERGNAALLQSTADMPQSAVEVAIIGGGPSGLAAALELKRRGIADIVVLERENEAGGIPRHCGHPPFGVREFSRVLTGPSYARRLVRAARGAGVTIRTAVTVVELRPGGDLLITSQQGPELLRARRVILATGVRETPRSARLISGVRALGALNTGALQSLVYLQNRKPFKRPVIVGTELVSFSAIMTCRHADIKPVAMIEAGAHVTARWPSSLFPKLVGLPLYLNTRLLSIEGTRRVSAVEVETRGHGRRLIECDGVILTGCFTPEASLARMGHLAIDRGTGGPLVDQYGRCSDPVYFAAGNLLRPVETAGWSFQEGRRCGGWVAGDLAGDLPDHARATQLVTSDPGIKYMMPQKLDQSSPPEGAKPDGMKYVQLRFEVRGKGVLTIHRGGDLVWQRSLHVAPERRILVPIKALTAPPSHATDTPLEFSFQIK